MLTFPHRAEEALREGDRVGARWRLTTRVPGRDAVERWRAVAEDTGEPVEVLLLGPAAADAAARTSFHDTHGALSRLQDPASIRVFEHQHGPDRSWVARAPLEDVTLGDLQGPLPVAAVAAIGARLLPAISAAGGATRGALLPDDVGLDDRGRPVLAPRGAPLTRVALGSTRSVAPEAFAGARPDGAAGLYGLGTLLYRLSTGREAPVAGTRSDRDVPPAPSTVRHGIPEAFDRAVLRLLSPDPGARAGALPLLQELAGELPDLRPYARRAVVGRVVTTRDPDSRLVVTEDRTPGGLVLIPADALRALEPGPRTLAAGLAGIPLSVLDGLVHDGLPLVVEATTGAAAARRRAPSLARETGLPLQAGTETLSGCLTTTLIGGLAVVPAMIAIGMLAAALWIPAAVLALAAVALVALGVVAGARSSSRGALFRVGSQALGRARDATAELSAAGALAPAWARLAEVRVQLGRADLPVAAAADLRDALKELERLLEGLARVATTTAGTLSRLDEGALRTRLAALQGAPTHGEHRAERDRLARTVADLDAVAARRAGVLAQAGRITDRLDEIAAVLGRVDDHDEAALVQVEETVRRARATAAEPEGEPAKPRPPPSREPAS